MARPEAFGLAEHLVDIECEHHAELRAPLIDERNVGRKLAVPARKFLVPFSGLTNQ